MRDAGAIGGSLSLLTSSSISSHAENSGQIHAQNAIQSHSAIGEEAEIRSETQAGLTARRDVCMGAALPCHPVSSEFAHRTLNVEGEKFPLD